MLNLSSIIQVAAPVAALSLPFYFAAKYLERKINPRKGFSYFISWIIIISALAFAWYFAGTFLFIKFFSLES
jgi:hypothetical protein